MVAPAQNGTIYGATAVSTPWVRGLRFDGVNDWVDLAENVVQNGEFTGVGAEWTCGVDWAIGFGVAHHDSGTASKIEQTITTILEGGLYRVTYQITDYAGAGTFGVSIGGNACGNYDADGDYVDYVFCAAAIDSIAIHADALAVFSVQYIKVEQVDRSFANRRLTLAAWVKPTDLAVGRRQVLITNGKTDWTNLLVDGDMEAAGVADWGGSRSTLTKAGTPHSGVQCLRVTFDANAGITWANAYQTILTVGKTYLVDGWARSDGTEVPYVYQGTTYPAWTGTNSTSWQHFSFTVVATVDGVIVFQADKTDAAGTEYVEFDDLAAFDLTTIENGKQGLLLDSGQTRFETVVGGIPRAILGTVLVEDAWKFVVATRDYDGVNTTLNLYEDGVLVTTEVFAGAPDISGHQTPMIGARGAGEFFEGDIADNVTIMYGAASPAWVAAEYARGIAVLYAGPYVEQSLSAAVSTSRTVTVHEWSDTDGSSDTFSMLMVQDALGTWHPIGQVGQIADVNTVLTELAAAGVLSVRLYCKGQTGFVYFDDVRFDDIVVTRAQVPARLRDKFERLILAGKPLHSWAGMLVDYV